MVIGARTDGGSPEPSKRVKSPSAARSEFGIIRPLDGRFEVSKADPVDEDGGGFEILDGFSRPFDDLSIVRSGESAQR